MVVETVLLCLIIIVLMSILWSTLRTGISPMPSSLSARSAMLTALAGTQGTVAELGSGWGHLALAVARRYPERDVIGYEISWLPWIVSVGLKKTFGVTNLHLYRADFLREIDHGQLDQVQVLLCYLHRPTMAALADRVRHLSSHGELSWVISNTFSLPGELPERRWRLQDFYGSPVYRYRLGN